MNRSDCTVKNGGYLNPPPLACTGGECYIPPN